MNKMLRAAAAGPGGSRLPKTFRPNDSKKQSGTPAQRSIFCNKGMFICTLPRISPWSGFTKAVAALQGRAALLRGLGGAAAPPYQLSFGRCRLNSRDGYIIS
jgi:hypothetical protein